jgi:CMP-N,N'-diacetyllegionaminic acid synthase
MNTTLLIILARAGSKGVPGKNTLLIGGRPCIAWTIEHALWTKRHSNHNIIDVLVSTDDPAVANIATCMGVPIHPRPHDLASDNARIDDAARSALDWYIQHNVKSPAPYRVALLYANVPIRPLTLTSDCLDILTSSGCDSVQSYTQVGKNHPYWTARLDDNGTVSPWEGDVLNHGIYRRQELPPAYIPDGGCLALTTAALRGLPDCNITSHPHAFFGHDRRGVATLPGEVVDIDSRIDAIVADTLLTHSLLTETNGAPTQPHAQPHAQPQSQPPAQRHPPIRIAA